MRGEVLFLAHRVPFPPDRGDRIRAHHLLKYIARHAPVHVGCLAEGAINPEAEAELAKTARSYCIAPQRKPMALAGIEALVGRKPVSLTAFGSKQLAFWVKQTLTQRQVSTVFIYSGQMGQYIPDGFNGLRLFDLCDVDSAKFEAYVPKSSFPLSWIYAREGRLLASEEMRLVRRARLTTLISEEECALLQSRIPDDGKANLRVLGNGVDSDFFDPNSVPAHDDLASASGPQIVFTGQMDYPPNVEACMRVISRILPKIRAHHRDAQFHIVGRAPLKQLLAYDRKDGVRVWGEVSDVRPFLKGADIFLAPLTIARGVQNKVLEAMAMECAVVVSPGAASGTGMVDGASGLIGKDDDEIVARVLSLLGDKPRARDIGEAARRHVLETKSWEAMLAPLDAMLGARGAADVGITDAA